MEDKPGASMPVDPQSDGPKGDQGQDRQQQAQQKQAEAKARQEDVKNSILSQVLTQEARGRLSTIAAAKPEKAKQLEAMICNMARYGKLPGKIDDVQLRSLLDRINAESKQGPTVKFDRRRAAIDSDDDDY